MDFYNRMTEDEEYGKGYHIGYRHGFIAAFVLASAFTLVVFALFKVIVN